MDLHEIKKVVEDYYDLLGRQERLQERLINLSGRDSEQEMTILSRLEEIERHVEIVDYAIYSGDVLTDRESWVLIQRINGYSNAEIGNFFSLTAERIRVILNSIYKKIAEVAKQKVA